MPLTRRKRFCPHVQCPRPFGHEQVATSVLARSLPVATRFVIAGFSRRLAPEHVANHVVFALKGLSCGLSATGRRVRRGVIDSLGSSKRHVPHAGLVNASHDSSLDRSTTSPNAASRSRGFVVLRSTPRSRSNNDRAVQPNDQVHRAGATALDEQRASVAPAPVQPLVRLRR